MKYLVVLKYGGWKSWVFRAGLWEYQEGLRSSRRIQNWSKEHHPFRSLLLFIPSPQSRSILLFVRLTIFSPDGCLFSDDAPLPQEAHHFWEDCAALNIISLFYFVCLLWDLILTQLDPHFTHALCLFIPYSFTRVNFHHLDGLPNCTSKSFYKQIHIFTHFSDL